MDRWRSRTRAPAEGASPLPWRCILETHVKQLFPHFLLPVCP